MADEERLPARSWIIVSSCAATGAAVDCRVLAIEPNRTLSYTWGAMGLEERGDLDPHARGRRARICAWNRRGSGRTRTRPIRAPKYGWQKFFAGLEQVLEKQSMKKKRRPGRQIRVPADRRAHQGAGRLARRDAGPAAGPDQTRPIPMWSRPGSGAGCRCGSMTASSAPARPTRTW